MIKQRLRALPFVLMLGGLLIAASGALPAGAVGTGQQGCTPGYWKNHTESWQEFSPNQTVGSVFFHTSGVPYNGATLLEALQFGGGSGTDGSARILLRAAVAAVLNAAHDDVAYPLQRHAGPPGGNGFVDDVVSALRSGNRSTMLSLASELDRLNNLGCPL